MAGRKAWPPKPGLTVITRTRSTVSSTYSTAAGGVAGLSATPAFAPSSRMRERLRSRWGPASAWTVTHIGAGGDEGFEVGIGGGDHQVRVERGAHARAEGGDHVGAQGDVGHEVAVHDVDLHPVGAGGLDGGNLLAEAGEVGGKDRGDDCRRPREGGQAHLSRRMRLDVSPRPPPMACTSL